MRIVRMVFVASGFLYYYAAMKLTNPGQQAPAGTFQSAITIIAFTCIILGFITRKLFGRVAESLAPKAQMSTEIKRWMMTSVISLVFFEMSILFGFTLHILGAPMWRVALLFGAGVASMLIWSPGPVPGEESGEFPRS